MILKVNVLFCGLLGSGKTTVSKTIAHKFGARWNSFGKTVAAIALDRGLATDRRQLQALGEDLVRSNP